MFCGEFLVPGTSQTPIRIVFIDCEALKRLFVCYADGNSQKSIPDRNHALATSKTCPIYGMLSKNRVCCYLHGTRKFGKHEEVVSNFVLMNNHDKSLSKTGFRSVIASKLLKP